MRFIFLFFILFMMCGIISGAAHAEPFITYDNPSLTREERIIKHIVDRNKAFPIHNEATHIETNLSDSHTYIFNDKESVSDRTYALLVQKLDKKNEHYTGH